MNNVQKVLPSQGYDDAIGLLREARALLLEEKDNGKNSRELSVCLTEIDTAILWRQEDLRLKQPIQNEMEELVKPLISKP